MRVLKERLTCKVCGENDAVVYCDGCEKPLCEDCRKFDMWGSGCGHIDTKVFCSACYDDININPWGGIRPQ